MDIPAYTGAILQLAKTLDKTLQTNLPVQEDLQTKADTFRLDCETETDGAENQSDQGQDMSAHTGVVIVSDMCLTKEHAEYVEKKLNLGRARVINCDSPFTDVSLSQMKRQVMDYAMNASVVMFQFEVLDTREYSYDCFDKFVKLAESISCSAKVIISSLPPRYVSMWENKQYDEHHQLNNFIWSCLDQRGSVGITMVDQYRLACPPGRLREDRYDEWGNLSLHGIFLSLKNSVAPLLPSSRGGTPAHRAATHSGRSSSWPTPDKRRYKTKISETKLISYLSKLLSD